jgi:hypothetical protein
MKDTDRHPLNDAPEGYTLAGTDAVVDFFQAREPLAETLIRSGFALPEVLDIDIRGFRTANERHKVFPPPPKRIYKRAVYKKNPKQKGGDTLRKYRAALKTEMITYSAGCHLMGIMQSHLARLVADGKVKGDRKTKMVGKDSLIAYFETK